MTAPTFTTARQRPAPPPLETRSFAPGSRVLARGEEWLVRRASRTSYGDTEVHVTGLSELVRGKDFVFLTPGLDEVVELKPEETALVGDDSPGYRKTRLYLESLLRASPPTEPRVYLGHKAAMDAVPYQLVPAAKALAQHRPRILIADAVGLGKTIEAGILLTELIRRGRGRRILVVALKSVLEQLQQELWARFTIPLVRLDSEGLARVQRRLPANANPFYYFDRVIISIDTLKKDEKYRRFLEKCHWDATLIDECQHVAVRARSAAGRSQRARLAELLAGTCDALVLTSATPHDGRPESFASLMNLLEPTAVADVESYSREDIQGLYVRRFKKDIAHQTREAFRPRLLRRHAVPASAAEDDVYALLADARFRTLDARGAGDGVLFRTTLLKGMLSSPEALLQTVDERIKKLHASSKAGADEDRALLGQLGERARAAAENGTNKLAEVVKLLRSMGVGAKADERVVLFSERIRTLELLERTLPEALSLPKEAVVVFHGSLDDTRQQALVKEFGTQDGRVRVLLCSDAASEGINLHFYCHRLIHYDIPWSLITLEQRNGRIDRFGQKYTPEVHYLLTEPGHERLRGDLRILEVLVEKEQQAHENLGDVRWLLDLHEVEKEEERIALAITRHEPAEDVLPDLDDLDLDEILASPTDLAPNGQQVDAETAEGHTLYASELAFWRDASLELERTGLSERPEWHDDI
jgi:SNF2 family DNA or RNA helicase